MFIHTCGSAPKMSAKFGRQKRTFCGKKEEKAVSQIKSDRLYDISHEYGGPNFIRSSNMYNLVLDLGN